MDWTGPLEAIRLAIASAAQLPDRPVPSSPRAGATLRAVEWVNRKTAQRATKGQWINLQLFRMGQVGRDETRYQLDDPDGEGNQALRPVVTGNRLLRVQLILKSDSQEPGLTADALSDRVRTRLSLPEVRAIMRAGGVTLSHVEWSADADYWDADERAMSEALMEVVFNAATYEVATTVPAGEGNDWFNRVQGEGELGYGEPGDPSNDVVTFDSDEGEPS